MAFEYDPPEESLQKRSQKRVGTTFTRGPLPIDFDNRDIYQENKYSFSVTLKWLDQTSFFSMEQTQPVAIRWRFLPKEESSSSSSSLGARRW